jgi:hypothetical protein
MGGAAVRGYKESADRFLGAATGTLPPMGWGPFPEFAETARVDPIDTGRSEFSCSLEGLLEDGALDDKGWVAGLVSRTASLYRGGAAVPCGAAAL